MTSTLLGTPCASNVVVFVAFPWRPAVIILSVNWWIQLISCCCCVYDMAKNEHFTTSVTSVWCQRHTSIVSRGVYLPKTFWAVPFPLSLIPLLFPSFTGRKTLIPSLLPFPFLPHPCKQGSWVSPTGFFFKSTWLQLKFLSISGQNMTTQHTHCFGCRVQTV